MESGNDGNITDTTKEMITALSRGPTANSLEALSKIDEVLTNDEDGGQILDLSQQIFDALIGAIGTTPLYECIAVDFICTSCRFMKRFLQKMEVFKIITITDDHINTLQTKMNGLNGNDMHTVHILHAFCKIFRYLGRFPQIRHRLVFVMTLLEFVRRNHQYGIKSFTCVSKTIQYYTISGGNNDIGEMTKYLQFLFDLLVPQYKSLHYFALVHIGEQIGKYHEAFEKVIQTPRIITDLLHAYNQSLLERVIWANFNEHAFLHELLPLFESFKSKKAEFKLTLIPTLDYIAGLCNKQVLTLIEPQYGLSSTVTMMLLNTTKRDLVARGLCLLEKIIFNLSKVDSKVISSNKGVKRKEEWDESEMFIKELTEFSQVRSAIDAIQNQDMDVLNEMLDKGLDIQLCDPRCQSIFQWVCSFGNQETVERLCSKLPNRVENHPMALHSAMQLERIDICRTLLQYFTFHSDTECSEFMERVNHSDNTCREEIETMIKGRIKRSEKPKPVQNKLPKSRTVNVNTKILIFASEILSILLLAFYQPNFESFRPIGIYLMRKVIALLTNKSIEFISDIPLNGLLLSHHFCQLVSTCIAHDDGTIIEPSLLLVNELLKKAPPVYRKLVQRYYLHDVTNRARILQALKLLEPHPTPKLNEPESISYLWHEWTISLVNELIIIQGESVIVSLDTSFAGRYLKGYFLTSDLNAEVKVLENGLLPNDIKGLKYKLLCLVDYIQQKYSRQRLGEDLQAQSQYWEIKIGDRPSKRSSPINAPENLRKIQRTENITTFSTRFFDPIPTFSSEETLMQIGNIKLEVIKSENGDQYLQVQSVNGFPLYALLFSPSMKQGFVYTSSRIMPTYPPDRDQDPFRIMIDNIVFQKFYKSERSETPRPKLCSITPGKKSVHLKADLKEIANEIRAKGTEENEDSILHRIHKGFENLRKILLDSSDYITPVEVLISGTVPALLECLSFSCCYCWENKNNEESISRNLRFLFKRRQLFLDTLGDKRVFARLEPSEHVRSLACTEANHNLKRAEFRKSELEGSVDYHVLYILSTWLKANGDRNIDPNIRITNPWYLWRLECGTHPIFTSRNRAYLFTSNFFTLFQVLNFNSIKMFDGNTNEISKLRNFIRRLENEIKAGYTPNDFETGKPFIEWLSARGRKDETTCINAVNTGFLHCFSFLPNSPMFWMRDQLTLPLDSRFNNRCLLCNNMPQDKSTFNNIDEDVLSGRTLGARFVIDLQLFIMPTAYTVTTIRNMDTNVDITNWCLQGSNNGEIWITLKVHRNDHSLDSRINVKFELNTSEFADLSIQNGLRGFRLFRILDLSPIAYQSRLHVCGLDLFGSVLYFYEGKMCPTILPRWDSMKIFHPQASEISASSTIAEAHLLNLAMAIRKDNRFEWAISNFTESWVRSFQDDEFYDFKIPPEVTNLRECLKPLYDSASLWKFRFHLIAVRPNNEIIASTEIPHVNTQIWPSLLKLAQKVADLKLDNYQNVRIILEITTDGQQYSNNSFYPRQINHGHNMLLSERDWSQANKQTNRLNDETVEFNELNGTKETAENILKLIRLLYHMRGCMDTNPQTWNSFTDVNSCFVAKKLSRKLSRQLDDKLASITGPTFPDWCFKLPHNMPYLFPFELRRRLLHISALGPIRSNNLMAVNPVERLSYMVKREVNSHLNQPVTELFSEFSISQEERILKRLEVLPPVDTPFISVEVSRDPTENDGGKLFWLYADELLHEQAPMKALVGYVYRDEVGQGLGVTRDFFTTLSKELLRKHHYLWLNDRENVSSEFINPSFGLFPTPYPRSSVPLNVIQRFYSMGIAVAKALQDNHLISLKFSRPFIKILSSFARAKSLSGDGRSVYDKLNSMEQWKNKAISSDDILFLNFGNHSRNSSSHWLTDLLDFNDFAELYPHYASLFRKFLELHKIHEAIRQNCSKTEGRANLEEQLNKASLWLIDSFIPDLCLSMQFYASSNLECKSVSLQEVYPWERGKFNTTMTENTHVEYIDNNNYMDYVRRMMEYCLDKGIRAQVDAFTWGFERVFPMDWLSVFSCSELEGIICGQQTDSPWSEAELSACIEPSFTLDKSSSTFRSLLKDGKKNRRQQFLEYVEIPFYNVRMLGSRGSATMIHLLNRQC
nr:E3 ubiquitin protein ligase HECTD1 [Hymenolepis microstoma]